MAALVAPPGYGKTFLLRLCERRFEREPSIAGAVYLPYAGLPAPDLASWVHGLIGSGFPAPPVDAQGGAAIAWLRELGRSAAEPWLLLVDDADSMPAETALELVRGLDRESSSLRVLMALGDDARASRLLARLDSLSPTEIRLQSPMSVAETAEYVRSRWRWAGLDSDAGIPFDDSDLERIHAFSGGVPLRVHHIAARLLDPMLGPLPDGLDAKLEREHWMGRPIGDEP